MPAPSLTISPSLAISPGFLGGRGRGRVKAPSLEAAELLAKRGIEARVVDLHTIKPIDQDEILSAAAETGAVMTVEEHNISGGLGSAVAEVLADHGVGMTFKRHGMPDEFAPIGPPRASPSWPATC